MSFKSEVKDQGSDRWWQQRWWLWWGDMHRKRWTRWRVNRMRLTEWRRELIPQVRWCIELLSGQDRRTLQPLQPTALELWLLMVHPASCPKSSASSARARGMRPLMSPSQVQVRGVQVARQVWQHRRRSPDVKLRVDQMILHSCLCQQFFPTTSWHLCQKSLVPTCILGKLQFQSWTKYSQIGMHEHNLLVIVQSLD